MHASFIAFNVCAILRSQGKRVSHVLQSCRESSDLIMWPISSTSVMELHGL
jgi:hypothetical protein